MTTLPRDSSSWMRTGRTSMIWASEWRSLVMIPDWEPVKEMASRPRFWMAMASSAMAMRSPVETSMSSSRRGGVSVTCRASASRSSVVRPMADTTVQIRSPPAALRAIRSATPSSLGRSATELPPYFCTTTSIRHLSPGPYITGDGTAATGPDFWPGGCAGEFGEAMRSRTGASYSPHSRLGWRGIDTTPGCHPGLP